MRAFKTGAGNALLHPANPLYIHSALPGGLDERGVDCARASPPPRPNDDPRAFILDVHRMPEIS